MIQKRTFFKKFNAENDFNRNVLTLMLGTTVAQAIPIAISPILTRIYTPEDFGVFAAFFALTGIFGSIANARYELAIMLPEKDEDALNIVAVGLVSTICICLLLTISIFLFKDIILKFIDGKDISNWLFFLPISVLFIGVFNVLTYFNSRRKNYNDIKNSTIIKSVVLSIIQIGVGLIKPSALGLVLGEVISRAFANGRLVKNIFMEKQFHNVINLHKMKEVAIFYKDFPLISVWAILFNNLAVKGTDLSISFFYSLNSLGFYSLIDKILGAPTSLIGKSFGQVYFQQASDEYKNTTTLKITFISTLKKSVCIGVLIFIPIYFLIEDIFIIIFGEKWHTAGVYGKYLTFLYFCRFITAPFTLTPIIINKVAIDLTFQVIMLIIVISLILIRTLNNFVIDTYLILISTYIGTYYLLYLVYIYLKIIRVYKINDNI